MTGAAGATGNLRRRSIRCLAKAAACAELPRAQVTTSAGGLRASRPASSLSGRTSACSWRATASGASRSSASTRLIDSRTPENRKSAVGVDVTSGYAMSTERASPRYAGIDLWSPEEALDAMIEGQLAAVAAVRTARGALEAAALAIETRLRDGGRLVYVGAGTSGRLAVQDGAELIPTFNWPKDRLLLLMAGGKDALLHSVENAEDETGAAQAA